MIERFGNKKKLYRVIYDIKMSNNYDHQKKMRQENAKNSLRLKY